MKPRQASIAFALCAGAAMATPAAADTLYADVTLNGRDLHLVVPFEQGPDGLEIAPRDLAAMGLKPQPQAVRTDGRIVLSAVPGLRYTLRAAEQAVDLTADPAIMAMRIINPEPGLILPDRADWGAVLNYAAAVTAPADGKVGYSATFEGRLFGSPGVLSASWFIQNIGGPGEDNGKPQKLDATFIHDDPANTRQFIFGDFVSGSQTWSRPVRGVGFSLQTDFSLRPELITQPLPMLRGAPSVPSTVDLYVDGIKQLSQPTAGPFEIRQPPVLTGYGQVRMVVTDTLGRETVQTFAFYGSDTLLRPGLTAYSLDAGWLRAGYAGPDDRYTDPFVQATARHGLSDDLTVEARIAGTKSLAEVGAGVVFKLRQFAVIALAADLNFGAAGTGGLWRASIEHRTGPFSIYGEVSRTFGHFRDLAARAGDPPIDLRILGGVGLAPAGWGNFNLNYTRVKTRFNDVGIVNASWNRPIGRRASLYVSGYVSQFDWQSHGVSAGIIVSFGRHGTMGAQVNARPDAPTSVSAHAEEAPPQDGGWGWRVRAEGGDADLDEIEGEVRLNSRLVDAAAAVETTRQGTSVRGFATGSVVWLTGAAPRFSSAVGESFAIVETGQPDIEIAQENRVIGRTGGDGSLLVPYVASFSPSRLEIVPDALPFSLRAARTEATVRPPRKAGVVVKLPVAPNRSLYLRVLMPTGKPPTVGLPVLADGTQVAVVGYDGLVWIEDATGKSGIEIADPDGRCVVAVPPATTQGAGQAQEVVCHAP